MAAKTPAPPLLKQAAGYQADRGSAIRCFEAGDYPAAARLLVSVLARVPPDALLLRLCGMALLRTGAARQGLPYLARARRLAPHDEAAALWLGIAQHAAGRFTEAAATLQASAALSPADPAPLIHLTRALLKLARHHDAAATARRAVSVAPDLAEARQALHLADIAVLSQPTASPDLPRLAETWLDLGRVCLRLGTIADARGAMHQALALQPDDPLAASDLAMVEYLCGEPMTAITRLRDVVARHPGCTTARLNLASRLSQGGDATGALSLLAGASPEAARQAQWQASKIEALIGLGQHDQARAELARVAGPAGDAEILLDWQRCRLEQVAGNRVAANILADRVACLAADRAAAGPQARIDAHFALADLRHAQGKREQAFAHWRAGHTLLRPAQPFSRTQHQALIDTTIRVFDRNRLSEGPRASSSDPAALFIVGLPRTGTTLTEHILAAHHAIHGAGERLAVRETLLRLTHARTREEAAVRAAALDAQALDEAGMAYLSALHDLAPQAAIILDKMPDNFMHLGFIATMLPGSRVICCTRDLRDVGASIFQHGFLGHHPYAHDLSDLGWAIAQHQRLLQHWQSALTLPMLLVDHADWVQDFDGTLARVLDFAGLPHDPACARFYEQERSVSTASRDQVKQPINDRGVGRWRAYAGQLAPMLRELPALPGVR